MIIEEADEEENEVEEEDVDIDEEVEEVEEFSPVSPGSEVAMINGHAIQSTLDEKGKGIALNETDVAERHPKRDSSLPANAAFTTGVTVEGSPVAKGAR